MEGELSYGQIQIKPELEVKEEYDEDISGSFDVKPQVDHNQDQDEIQDEDQLQTTINYPDPDAEDPPSPVKVKSNWTPTNGPKKLLVISLKNLTANEIHGYQAYIKRWGFRGTKTYNRKEPNKKIGCNICGKFLHPRCMLNHVNSHLGLKAHECPVCHKKFTWKTALDNHKHLHIETDDLFPCSKCGKTFKLKFRLNQHIKRVHMTDSSKFRCQQCEKSFKYQKTLTKHVNIVHLGEKTITSTRIFKKTLTVCDVCNKSSTNIYQHMYSHSDARYPCDVCYQTFNSPAGLRIHKLSVHMKIKPKTIRNRKKVEQKPEIDLAVECKICFKMVKSSILENHGKYHSGENTFLCEICLKSAPSKSALRYHNTKWHSDNEKKNPFSCSKCPMTFKIKINFELHVKFNRCHKRRSKKFPRSFTCEICLEEYPDFPTFKEHKKTHIRNMKCQFCSQIFKLKKSWRRHINRVHLDELGLKEESPDEKKEKGECILGL